MHRSIFESLMRTLKGNLLYQAEYLSRLLVKPPTARSEAEVLKLASYLTSLQRFQEVPQRQLVQLAKEVTYAELPAGSVVCKQGGPRLITCMPECNVCLLTSQWQSHKQWCMYCSRKDLGARWRGSFDSVVVLQTTPSCLLRRLLFDHLQFFNCEFGV